MRSVIARAASRRLLLGKRSSMRTKAMTDGSDNAVRYSPGPLSLELRPLEPTICSTEEAQRLGHSDEARARQSILTVLVFLDLLKSHAEVFANFLLGHVFRKTERSHPLTDDLVHLARYWRSFLPSRRRCHRRRPSFLTRLMRPAPNDNQRGWRAILGD